MDGLPSLTKSSLTLRPWRLGDAAELQREIQDPEIVRWLGISLPYTLDEAIAFIAATQGRWEERVAAHFVIADAETDALVGYLGALAAEDRMRVVEIVYWVAACARGRGVATAALRLALPWITETMGPQRIELGMVDGNTASARVAEANGFVLREVVRAVATLDGAPADERIYQWNPRALPDEALRRHHGESPTLRSPLQVGEITTPRRRPLE